MSRLAIEENPITGRTFVATEDIEAGSLLYIAQPYAVVPDTDAQNKICYFCMKDKKLQVLLKCQGKCGQVSYCQESCRESDALLHQYECKFWTELPLQDYKLSDYTKDYLRLLVRCLIQRCLEFQSTAGKEHQHSNLPPSTFNDVWKLCSNQSAFSDERLLEFQKVVHILDLFQKTLPHRTNVAASEYRPLSSNQLLELICKEECNSFGLYDTETDSTVSRQSYGLALFPSVVYFNHSCYPNALHATSSAKYQTFFAGQHGIKKGQQVHISYIELGMNDRMRQEELKDSKAFTVKRQQHLMNIFHFKCECQRCQLGQQDRLEASSLYDELRQMCCERANCLGVYLPHVTIDAEQCLKDEPKSVSRTYKGPIADWTCSGCHHNKQLT